MDKDKKIARLEQKLADAQNEIKNLKSKVKEAKATARKESKKKDVKNVRLNKEQEQLLLNLLKDIGFQS